MAKDGLEQFRSGSGRVMGYVGVLLGAVVAVLATPDGLHRDDAPVLLGGALVAAVSWVVLLRPVVALSPDRILVRSILSEVWLPLAAIEEVHVRQFLVVRAGGRTFSSTALGRSKHQIMRRGKDGPDPRRVPADLFEDRIRSRAESARAQAGIALMSDEQFALGSAVHRTWAWPVIALLAVLGAAFAVVLVVGSGR